MGGVSKVIHNLRKWRALPGYSVERRIDVLLTPYLEEFLGNQMKAPVDLVTAEFPLPKQLFRGAEGKHRHIAVDFLCVRRGNSPAWILVELKTDTASRRARQDAAYRVCAQAGMSVVLTSIRDTKQGTRHARGYARLIGRVRAAAPGLVPIEVCYLEPRSGSWPKRVVGDDGVVTWSFGLRQFTHGVAAPAGDDLWPLLTKLLRGIARSDKARHVKSKITPA